MPKSILRLKTDIELEPGGPPEGVLEGNPVQAAPGAYSGADAEVLAGVWAYEPGKFSGGDYPTEEICFIQARRLVIIDDENGDGQIFEPGDAFVSPKCAITTWVVREGDVESRPGERLAGGPRKIVRFEPPISPIVIGCSS